MLRSSVPELVFIRVCIFLVQYVISLSVLLIALLHVTLFRATGTPPALTRTLAFLVAVELFYAVLIYLPFKARLHSPARHPPPLTPGERSKLVVRCLASIADPERYLQLWFLGARPEDIKRDNVRDFVLWAFFDQKSVEKVYSANEHNPTPDSDGGIVANESEGGRPLLDTGGDITVDGGVEDVDPLERELEAYLARIEKMLGRPLPPGRGTAVPLLLTFDAVETRYRSVVWYALVSLVDFATHCRLFWYGFQLRAPSWRSSLSVFPLRPGLLVPSLLPGPTLAWKRRSPSRTLGYWYRPHTSNTNLPVVFIHGIGIGLYPYTAFLASVPRETGIIALEILSISMRLYAEPLSRPDFLRQVECIVAHHGWDRFVLVSHSYGSVLTTHILRSPALAPRVTGVVLIDPVSICLHLPDVAYNFTRRRPRRAKEWLLWYFGSMDPGTALALGRHFFWRENLIWKEELVSLPSDSGMVQQENGGVGTDTGTGQGGIGAAKEQLSQNTKRKMAVVLAGRDLIVDTRSVVRYLLFDGDLRSSLPHNENELLEQLAEQAEADHGSTEREGGNGSCLTKDGIEILWFPTLDHSEVFETAKNRSQVLDVIMKYCLI